ncbi:MAG TPA: DUF4466 family protein [Prolixibacteraceae bacterium]|nr:DUF4466 family protein [Prolixibacteraceae bacterium]
MQRKYFSLITVMLAVIIYSSCKEEDYSLPLGKTGLNNDCIKRTLGPNIVGTNIEFAYAMALPKAEGKIVSAQVEASIAGATGTYLEYRSFYTNSSGVDVGITVGSPSVTTDKITLVAFTKDTCAATLRYFYTVPEAARGGSVSFTFSATSSNGMTVSYKMGPYAITSMDMKLDLVATDNKACYLSIADMALYDATTAVANAGKIDLVYLYRSIPGITFTHALVSPAANPEYLPGITLPAGVNKSSKMSKTWALNDFNLARLQYGIYIDDADFKVVDFTNAPNYVLNLKAQAGTWVETADGKYRAYIYINAVNNTTPSMTISIKRFLMQ